MPERTIVHVDMNAFFVSVELLDRPELVGRPVVVGGAGERGVVAAASYEARRYGIHSAMPSTRARRLCPHAVFLHGRHDRYAEVSRSVMALARTFTPLVEPISLDEAFLDVTGAARLHGDGAQIAAALRQRVHDELGLGCSVGVAPSKFVAKLASEAAKPRASMAGIDPGPGVVVVEADDVVAFLHPLPVQALWGVGPKTLEKLRRMGVTTVGELAGLPVDALVASLGRAAGSHLHELANGIDTREVVPDQEVRSISHEETFAHDLHDHGALHAELVRLADAVAARLRAAGVGGRTVTVKVKFGDFTSVSRASTLPHTIDDGPTIVAVADALLRTIDPTPGVRLLGVGASALGPPGPRQLSFDDALASTKDWTSATDAVDAIRAKFGREAIGPASLAGPDGLRPKRQGDQQWGPDQLRDDPEPT
ncbi:MAG: DNA polymerase IV [Acidimicrobiales bacterium]|nr:DNA polymerase IV [Acidimicrobiales bacterium]